MDYTEHQSDNLKLVELNIEEIANLYHTRMVNDFAQDELKPLAMIETAMGKGIYTALGLQKGDEIISYAFFYRVERDYLFDYFATKDTERGKGYGAIFLKLIDEYFATADSVIGEVEDPEYAVSEADKELRIRRYHMYMRNGAVDTKVKVRMYGVDYLVIEFVHGDRRHNEQEIMELYDKIYRQMFPPHLYRTKVIIKNFKKTY